jgi:hypothetical protein
MFSNRGVIAGLNDIAAELFIIGNIEFPLIINESVLFFPFKEAVEKSAGSFGFEGFEGLSHRGFTIQAVLDALFK